MTSKYKNCSQKGFSFLSATYTGLFNERVKNDYQKSLENMRTFMNNFLNTDANEIYIQFINSLLDLIEIDKTIDANDLFYVLPDGNPIVKSDFCNFSNGSFDVCFPAFLLGIWHFIISKREDNSVGSATIVRWSGNPLKNWFRGDMRTVSEMSKHQIKVYFNLPIDLHSAPNKECELDKSNDNSPAFLNDETASQTIATSEMLEMFKQAVASYNIAVYVCNVADYLCGNSVNFGDALGFIDTIQNTILIKFVTSQGEEMFKKIAEFNTALESYCAFLGMIRASVSEYYGFIWRMYKSYDMINELIYKNRSEIEKTLAEEECKTVVTLEKDMESKPNMDLKTKIIQLNFIDSIFSRHKEIVSLFENICNEKTLLVF